MKYYVSPSLLAADFTRLGDEVQKVHRAGGRVTIRNAGRLVKQILDMSGVFTLMEYEDVPRDV